MANLTSLNDVLEECLKDIYSAETQLVKALPKMAKAVSNKSLREAIEMHLEETEQQVERLNQIAEKLDIKLKGKTCKAMQGLLEEGKEAMDEESDNSALVDALIIAAAQKVEHYEISAYGTARAIAEQLELDEVVELLQETIEEEGAADEKLSQISEEEVLIEAQGGAEEESEEEEEVSRPIPGNKKKGGSSDTSRAR